MRASYSQFWKVLWLVELDKDITELQMLDNLMGSQMYEEIEIS